MKRIECERAPDIAVYDVDDVGEVDLRIGAEDDDEQKWASLLPNEADAVAVALIQATSAADRDIVGAPMSTLSSKARIDLALRLIRSAK
jgi:hypothetical protein